jgi:hypothetical protein
MTLRYNDCYQRCYVATLRLELLSCLWWFCFENELRGTGWLVSCMLGVSLFAPVLSDLTLGEGHRLRAFENMVLKKMF